MSYCKTIVKEYCPEILVKIPGTRWIGIYYVIGVRIVENFSPGLSKEDAEKEFHSRMIMMWKAINVVL